LCFLDEFVLCFVTVLHHNIFLYSIIYYLLLLGGGGMVGLEWRREGGGAFIYCLMLYSIIASNPFLDILLMYLIHPGVS